MQHYDIAIIGGGILGLSVAKTLTDLLPQKSIAILEKEHTPALHQSGRNSNIVHSGIYYPPESLKAKLCQRGRTLLFRLAEELHQPIETTGKVLVASDSSQDRDLENLYQRALHNGIPCQRWSQAQLQEREPYVVAGNALFIPTTGILDFYRWCQKLASHCQDQGVQILTRHGLRQIDNQADRKILETDINPISCHWLINTAGLQSDRIAKLDQCQVNHAIVPFKGEYYALEPHAQHLCNNIIYPVPDPRLPFLGVHFNRTPWGHIEAGPNAFLSYGRESYSLGSINLKDLSESVISPALWKLAWHFRDKAFQELLSSWSQQAYLQACQTLIPSLTIHDITYRRSGIRAQAIKPNGHLEDDFVILDRPKAIHVINAPSPGATASLAIAEEIAQRLVRRYPENTH